MPVTTVTKDTGGKTIPTEMTFVAPTEEFPEKVRESFLEGSGLNGPFLADLISQFLAHEQGGFHLYRVLAGQTQNPMLKSKYEEFGSETEHHIEVLEQLLEQVGGDPGYVSPAARLNEAMNGKLLEAVALTTGSADLMTRELAMVEALILAETKDHADWKFLEKLTQQLPEGHVKEAFTMAVGKVGPQEEDHIEWAKSAWEELAMTQAEHERGAEIMGKAEKAMEKVKDKLSRD